MSIKKIIRRNKDYYTNSFRLLYIGVELSYDVKQHIRRALREEARSLTKHFRLIDDSV